LPRINRSADWKQHNFEKWSNGQRVVAMAFVGCREINGQWESASLGFTGSRNRRKAEITELILERKIKE